MNRCPCRIECLTCPAMPNTECTNYCVSPRCSFWCGCAPRGARTSGYRYARHRGMSCVFAVCSWLAGWLPEGSLNWNRKWSNKVWLSRELAEIRGLWWEISKWSKVKPKEFEIEKLKWISTLYYFPVSTVAFVMNVNFLVALWRTTYTLRIDVIPVDSVERTFYVLLSFLIFQFPCLPSPIFHAFRPKLSAFDSW